MINTEGNPSFLNSFLDYTATILNKSPATVKEYNYDISRFLKFIMYHLKLTDEKNIDNQNVSISISAVDKEKIHKINKEYRNVDRDTAERNIRRSFK